MKVYISGKIGEGNPSPETLAKFRKAEDLLLEKGYEVFNPTTSGLGGMAEECVDQAKADGLETTWYAEILKLDLDALSFCDVIYMLPDWQGSPGGRTEYQFAIALKKKILFGEKYSAEDFLRNQFLERIRNGKYELSPSTSFTRAMDQYVERNIKGIVLNYND